MRDYVLLYINGRRVKINDERAFMPLANFLRYEQSKPGTKIVCAEGDCGACTVLKGTLVSGQEDKRLSFVPFNSCIAPVFLMDCSHIITVEGLEVSSNELDPIQRSFVECNASQCGYCTPGFIMAMAGLFEKKSSPNSKDIQNYLTGNLCRCTGYDSIITAGMRVEGNKRLTVSDRYHRIEIIDDLQNHQQIQISLQAKGYTFDAPTDIAGAIEVRSSYNSRLVSAATDLGVQINKQRINPTKFLSLHLIQEMYELSETDTDVLVGAKITIENLRCFIKGSMPEFSEFLHLFASPQIKNVGTLIGNVANASPIADTTPYLMMADATIVLQGKNGTRMVPMVDFYKGYKVLDMEDDELISAIRIPKPSQNEIIKVYKVSARRDLDISCVNAAISMSAVKDCITDIRIAYGGIGPMVKRLSNTEEYLLGRTINKNNFVAASGLISDEITPISDVRGSDSFRYRLAKNLLKRFYVDVMLDKKEVAK
jgi:xanthine dehydrogenase small subunit